MTEHASGITLSEVMARITFRLIELDWRRNPHLYDDPKERILQLYRDLDNKGFRALSWWVLSAAYYLGRDGMRLAYWRDWCIIRARRYRYNVLAGRPWQRGADPRVTNRGVSTPVRCVRLPLVPTRARWTDD
jgi:hypothetical protein